jgi:hypothetical protein
VSRRSARAAQRADLSGIGPSLIGREPDRWPGATAKFALFGEVLFIGVIVALLSLPLVTLPLAVAVGSRHLRLFLEARKAGIRSLLTEFGRGLLSSLPIGLGAVAVTVALLVYLALAGDRVIPFAEAVTVIAWLGFAVLAVAVLTAARLWSPELGWRAAFRAVPAAVRADLGGSAYLLASAALVVVVTWQLFPLVIPGLGCLVLALVAIPERPRRGVAA